MHRIFVIASVTYKEIVRQSLFYIIILASTALLFVSPLFVLYTFGEDIEEISMVREVGLATISFAGLIIAILMADLVIASEIEQQTVLTTLAKPVKKSEFVMGKFMGIMAGVLAVTIFLGLIFILVYWLREGRTLLESNFIEGKYLKDPRLVWDDTFEFLNATIGLLLKGVYSSFLQVMVVSAVAVALASFFSLVITAGGCLIFFILGHISNYIYGGDSGKSIFLVIPGKVIYTFLPNLTNFNLTPLVATNTPISLKYLGWLTLYGMLYSGFILGITIILFNRREIR